MPVGPASVTIYFDDRVIVCGPDSQIDRRAKQGLFGRDTRLLSEYQVRIGAETPICINSAVIEHFSSRFELTNQALETSDTTLQSHRLRMTIDRVVGEGVHEDYDVINHSTDVVSTSLEVRLESDFADVFEVKAGHLIQRGELRTLWLEDQQTLETTYHHGDFRRSIAFRPERSDSPVAFANGELVWHLELAPGAHWHTCLLWDLDLGEDRLLVAPHPCHALVGLDGKGLETQRSWNQRTTSFSTSDRRFSDIAARAIDDLGSLRLHVHDRIAAPWGNEADDDSWVPAGGVPWSLTLFGRDALVVSLQTLSLSPRFSLGTLRALARLQADRYDDARDMQPGKIEHEVRHGELASLGLIPHTPYFGTHEATTLYVLAAARAWWWHGDRSELDAIRDTVERALGWIDRDGDLDGDGLQEYRTRAGRAVDHNQGWKSAAGAIVDERGDAPIPPVALCEHQGLVVAAKREWADVLEAAYGDRSTPVRLRREADALAARIEEHFWWEEEGTYFLGLDGNKRPLRSLASNPGLLLFTGAIDRDRARKTANRLLREDLWSGWGIRTLSTSHPAYNPFSYQRGSVWPHDTVMAAAGFRRYGLEAEATQVIRGILDAAAHFRSLQLPELFGGHERRDGSFPVPYLEANVPSAWASGAVVQALEILLGPEVNAAERSLVFRPMLPGWLTDISFQGLRVGAGRVDGRIGRAGETSYELIVQGAYNINVSLDG